MLLALAIAVSTQVLAAPTLVPGVSSEFSNACIKVEELLESGQFDAAKQELTLMPKKVVTVVWDDSKVPSTMRTAFADAREQAFQVWSRNLGDVQFKLNPHSGDLKFEFEKVLPENAASGMPAGSTLTFPSHSSRPRLEVVIGLHRGKPSEPVDRVNAYNEITHAIANYFGLAATPFVGTATGRSDLPSKGMWNPTTADLAIAQANLRAVNLLATAAEKEAKLTPARPSATVDQTFLEHDQVVQGARVEFVLNITNSGDAPLTYRGQPDCSCVTTNRGPQQIGPGASSELKVMIDTTDVAGSLDKNLILLTNDPKMPVRSIPVRVTTLPRYRFLSTSPSTMIVPQGGAKFDVFLVTPPAMPLDIVETRLEGLTGTVQTKPWEGELADPELNEPAKKRTGTKMHVELQESQLNGRQPVTLLVLTKDPVFRELRYSVAIQKGIVTLPASVFMGELTDPGKRGSALISRPGIPFKVLSAVADSSFLDVDVKPSRGEYEYQLVVTYKGRAPKGNFQSNVEVKTSDPKQPVLNVSIQAIVR
jgi:hypothetical protein